MDLGKTQFLSLVTKALTIGLGAVQSFIILRLLSVPEVGLMGLVMSIGGLIGTAQHLGIVDGAIREIAVLTDKAKISKVFWVSHLMRQVITIPLSIALVFLAPWIATSIYHYPQIVWYLRLFAATLVLQGLQDVLGATLTGLKQFKQLYLAQIATAAINIVAFGYLTWRGGLTGFFWAIIITTSIMVIWLGYLALSQLAGFWKWPTRADIRFYGQRVISISKYMYVARIFYNIWRVLPIIILGTVLAADKIGLINVALTFSGRLTIISMALSEVNLAWMSSLYATKREEFNVVVARNMQRVLVLLLACTLLLLFFVPEILKIAGHDYAPAQPFVLFMTAAFFLYALTDIGTSSLFASANEPKLRALAYGLMTIVTAALIGLLLITRPDALWATIAVLVGAVIGYGVMVGLAHYRFKITLVTPQLWWLLGMLAASIGWLYFSPPLGWRIVVFFLLVAYVTYEAHRSQLLPAPLQVQREPKRPDQLLHIICFAGAPYDQLAWTNRQHMMSRVSQQYPVLYIEPRMWVVKIILKYWRQPKRLWSFLLRVFWYEKKHDNLFIKAQWNLIPGSRELGFISAFNHYLNRFNVRLIAQWLRFDVEPLYLWMYDTEAVEYLNVWPRAKVLYDCVDDHAAQAGVDRNPKKVATEEAVIVKRANLVTVTSRKLLELKQQDNPNTHLVLNAGDVELFSQVPETQNTTQAREQLQTIPHPRLGAVGALDAYKFDFDLLAQVAQTRPDWQFVLIGTPVVDHNEKAILKVKKLPNVHFLGAMSRQVVPAFVQEFDICMIPYVSSRYNEASFPLKFWEFMATGKPIIVTGLPELKPYQDIIGYAQSAADFIKVSEQWLRHPEQATEQRRQLAQSHTWQHRVDTVLDLVRHTL